jgi:hypothetical protein
MSWVMRHLIHVFILVILLAFVMMVRMISEENSQPDWTMTSDT